MLTEERSLSSAPTKSFCMQVQVAYTTTTITTTPRVRADVSLDSIFQSFIIAIAKIQKATE